MPSAIRKAFTVKDNDYFHCWVECCWFRLQIKIVSINKRQCHKNKGKLLFSATFFFQYHNLWEVLLLVFKLLQKAPSPGFSLSGSTPRCSLQALLLDDGALVLLPWSFGMWGLRVWASDHLVPLKRWYLKVFEDHSDFLLCWTSFVAKGLY